MLQHLAKNLPAQRKIATVRDVATERDTTDAFALRGRRLLGLGMLIETLREMTIDPESLRSGPERDEMRALKAQAPGWINSEMFDVAVSLADLPRSIATMRKMCLSEPVRMRRFFEQLREELDRQITEEHRARPGELQVDLPPRRNWIFEGAAAVVTRAPRGAQAPMFDELATQRERVAWNAAPRSEPVRNVLSPKAHANAG